MNEKVKQLRRAIANIQRLTADNLTMIKGESPIFHLAEVRAYGVVLHMIDAILKEKENESRSNY